VNVPAAAAAVYAGDTEMMQVMSVRSQVIPCMPAAAVQCVPGSVDESEC